MDEEKNIMKVLKWAGIIVLVALPIAILLKKRRAEVPVPVQREDDADFYTSDLHE
jgi:hypothetical protein